MKLQTLEGRIFKPTASLSLLFAILMYLGRLKVGETNLYLKGAALSPAFQMLPVLISSQNDLMPRSTCFRILISKDAVSVQIRIIFIAAEGAAAAGIAIYMI